METIKINSYEIRKSRTDHDIPIVNGIHLHSAYNPIREAAALISKHRDSLKIGNEALILGLGFAYHVEEVVRIFKEAHGENYKIVIIEPNRKVYDDSRFSNCLKSENVKIYFGDHVEHYFSAKDLVNFLASRPVVIAHPASFNLYSTFFQNFLSYKAPERIDSIVNFIESSTLKEYLLNRSEHLSIEAFIEDEVEATTHMSGDFDFLMKAFKNMTPTKKDSEAQ